jgi:carboxymethylenebutenolidase
MSRTSVHIDTRDGRAPAYVFKPESGPGPWPVLLFFPDGRGIRPALFEVGERIAQAGFYVLLPDLFYRAGPYEAPGPTAFSTDPAFREHWFKNFIGSASPDNVRRDTESFLAFLDAEADADARKLGVSGYCFSGGLALSTAAYFPERVVAAASYHGGNLASDAPNSPHLLAPKIKARVYVAGAIEDASFPDAQKERLIGALREAHVRHVVETYEGARHGFVPPDSAAYQPEAAARHDRSLLALLNESLRPSGAAQRA